MRAVNTIDKPRASAADQNIFFFLSDSFVFRNNPDNVETFRFEENGVEVVKIFFSRSGNSIKSLDYSPFGGFVLSPGASQDTLARMLAHIEDWCARSGVKEICIRVYPNIYNPAESELVHRVLQRVGYRVVLKELLQFIAIDHDSFARFNRNRRRKLRGCVEAGFRFVRLSSDQIGTAYKIFVECRNNKNYPVTMSLADFENAFEKFPEQYFLFGVLDGDTLVAASVCVAVNDKILYDFFHGDKLIARKFSPITLLLKGIIEFCLAHDFRLLDLGVSTDTSGVNAGLQRFKYSFGSSDSQKFTFYKRVSNA